MSDRFPEPTEAMEFLSNKLNIETGDWDDLKWGEHSHAFTVAHSTEAGIVDDIHGLLKKAMADGESYGTFRKGMLQAMEAKGWYGRRDIGPEDKAYINWRIRTIYDTNMKTAFSAARERKQSDNAEGRPIWVYKSKLVGENRRSEHIALHDMAFRHDDPFWDENYPPNGWGCDCTVVTKSVSGAERDKVKVLESGPDGSPPPMTDKQGNPIDWDKFTPDTWKYNPGKEAVAPNFTNYKNLAEYRMEDGRTALRHVVDRFRESMDGTRMDSGEFKTLVTQMEKKDYNPHNITYQMGNLNAPRHEAMMKAGIGDSRIMGTDRALYHGTADKNTGQKVPARLFDDLYQTMQTPEQIYENTTPKSKRFGREFHFVKSTKDGKVIKVVLRQRMPTTALRIVTMGWVEDQYGNPVYKKIW